LIEKFQFQKGFDTRAVRFTSLLQKQDAWTYEVDLEATQQYKRKVLKKKMNETDLRVRYVAADLSLPDGFSRLFSDLVKAGYKPQEKTFFFWEGVSMYLTESAVINTLTFMSNISHDHALLFFDHFTQCIVNTEGKSKETILHLCEDDPKLQANAWRLYLNHKLHGEPLQFGMMKDQVPQFLTNVGFSLKTLYDAKYLQQEFLSYENGDTFGVLPPYLSLVLANKTSSVFSSS
jgi:methyltransferase (TIGR00027 family)